MDDSAIPFGCEDADYESKSFYEKLQRRVLKAIQEIDEHDQEIIFMRLFQRMSNPEVARDMGLPEATASKRCVRAIRRLKQHMTTEG